MNPESKLIGQEMETLQKIVDMVTQFVVTYSFQILGALIILIVGLKLSGWLSRLVLRVCEKRNIDITLSKFFASSVKLMIMVFVVIVAIGKFGISIAPFIAALGALAFGTSFAIQGPLSNYGSGLTLILTRPFVVGNTIQVQGVSGVVDEIRLAATILSTEDGEQITIPNKHIVGEILTNSFENRIIETSVGISYDDDPEQAIEVLQQVLNRFDEVRKDPAPQVGIEAFADSSINIGLRYWVPTKQYFQTLYQVNLAIHKALAEAGVHIPFPQQDVHLIQEKTRD
ncbi:mechanosensitive ion channel family protein [Syntrophotalea carbinolica DSM 2380]|uniref:Mechanosensitive ion channel family protein n=1 Tax=Syntrophotalea carbinolica (strain DSM 2380 / NBRC 103641 / GraBd1) TaxID=338963 RepID=Q3A7S8_SYNC1|nr:mechanosensitive ion channel family protein [Syntrophotalea carbinolica]ABA87566.1 mechanosensitive ion channel family protein [Syntrophotalea carbinolica DSM 2380]